MRQKPKTVQYIDETSSFLKSRITCTNLTAVAIEQWDIRFFSYSPLRFFTFHRPCINIVENHLGNGSNKKRNFSFAKAYLPKLSQNHPAGFLACLIIGCLPVTKVTVTFFSSEFTETHSSGYCAGLTPASLSSSFTDEAAFTEKFWQKYTIFFIPNALQSFLKRIFAVRTLS